MNSKIPLPRGMTLSTRKTKVAPKTQMVLWTPPPAKKKQRKPKSANQAQLSFRARSSLGNAVILRSVRIGMPDLRSHVVSWVAGYIYVGNGTLGATNSVYFRTASGTYTMPGLVPIAGADTDMGASYVKAIDQLYRRKVYKRIFVRIMPLQSSTTNNLTYTVAPIRGPMGAGEGGTAGTGVGATDTTASIPQITVLSMTGNQTRDSFEGLNLDLTQYIAGGSGARQNEFSIPNELGTSTAFAGGAGAIGVVPCCFVIGGTSSVTALQATNTHAVVIETVCDYLDFVGAKTDVDPVG